MCHQLNGGAGERPNIHAAMLAEARVLVGDQGIHEQRVDVGEGRGQAPAAVGDGEGAEQDAVAVDDQRAGLLAQLGSSTRATAAFSASGAAIARTERARTPAEATISPI
jgi:hypothetical protein